MKTVYVGMALTEAPHHFRTTFQDQVKLGLRNSGVKILDFVGLEAGDDTDVYHHDRSCTERADLVAFIMDHASTGLGMEVVFRLVTGKPMLLFANEDQRVTRMATGLAKVEDIPFIRYTTADQIVDAIIGHLQA